MMTPEPPSLTSGPAASRPSRRRCWFLGLLGSWAAFTALGVWRWERIAGSWRQVQERLFGSGAPFRDEDLDTALASLSLLVVWIASAVLIARASSARSAPRRSEPPAARRGLWLEALRRLGSSRLATSGLVLLALVHLVALLCPLLAPSLPHEHGDIVLGRFLPPSLDHPLGTDRLARDVGSRVLYGSRVSLAVGFFSVLLAVGIGTLWGAVAGYAGGRLDALLMRIVDLLLAFPGLVLLITVVALWDAHSLWVLVAVIGALSWPGVARLVRGQFLTLREREFVIAARALGASPARIILRHLIPNASTPIIVAATLRVGNVILLEAGLSYLGLGIQPPTPSWGNIIFEASDSVLTAWWIPLSAGLAIVLTVVGYNLLGDGLRDALDPRQAP